MRIGQKINTARHLRRRETDFERRLWKELRDRRAFGLKFRRQHAVASYVVDFACLDARLLIEIDGYWHAFRKAEDQERDRILKASGFDILRYDIENEGADAHTIAEAIAHEAKLRIGR